MSDRRTVYRVCPFCEATCGLTVEVEDNSIIAVRGDKDDPFSRGFICPKAYGLKELYHDPDRLRQPVRRTATGWEEITWDEAYTEVAVRLLGIREQYGNDAIGMYLGNPLVHDLAFLYVPILARALASRSVFNASAIDTLPVDLGAAAGLVNGLEAVEAIAREFAPELVANYCGISAATIRRLAREQAAAESAACYGRLGTCVQEFGTLASWGIDLVNILTGNLDRPGGVMFTTPAASLAALSKGKDFDFGRGRSRVSSQPVTYGMLPSSTMAEEMLTPGDGQVRAMILLMTNPLRSAANSTQLEAAFSQLDFLVAVDCYLNETTRHAHIILPTPSPAEQPNYEYGLYHLAVRNLTKWSSPAVSAPPGSAAAWEVLVQLSAVFLGMVGRSTKEIDDMIFRQLAAALLGKMRSWPGLTLEEVIAKLDETIGPERVVDMLVRLGPYGDGFGRRPDGLTLAKVRASEHGIDLGPLQPRLREILNTPSGVIELAPPTMTADIARLRIHMTQRTDGTVLIGRRGLRTSNSFMHNLPALVKGPDRCTLQISRQDAARRGLTDGNSARITSRVGSIVAPVEVTEDLMPGVVSLPHGWGHDVAESRLSVAKAHPGVNANLLTDDRAYDEASGTAVLFGTPVTVEPLRQHPEEATE